MNVLKAKLKISSRKLIKITISVLIVSAFIYGLYGAINDISDKGNVYKIDATDFIDLVTNKVQIKQEINIQDGKFNSISIRPATYGRINEGELIFKLYQDGNVIPLTVRKLDISKLQNNEFVDFEFNTINVKVGEKYYFIIETTSTSVNNCPAISKNSLENDNYNLYINNEKVEGKLCYKIGYNKFDFIVFILILSILLIFTTVFSYFSDELVNKKNIILSGLFLICSSVFTYLNKRVFYQENQFNFHYIIIAYALIFSICYFLFYGNYFKNKIEDKIYVVIMSLVSPFVLLIIIELFNNNLIYKMNIKIIFMNYISILVIYLFFYVITSRINITLIISNIICYLVGLAYYYILLFRGSPILPTDFYALGTAESVAGNYEFKMNLLVFIISLLVILLCVASRNFRIKFESKKISICVKVLILIYILFWGTGYNSIFEKAGPSIDLWDQKSSYKSNGVIVSFLINTKYLNVEVPKNYSLEEVNSIASEVGSNMSDRSANDISPNRPNIIAIMNESFSDLKVVGDFKTNEDYMPFIHNLNKNTIKGNLFVSVYGGGTSTTEWEFLTGNSMAFLPPGALPYQQYIHTQANSLVRNLKSLSYDTVALHPYLGSGWNRDKAYPLLGFDKFITVDDFKDPELVRNCFISDSEDYKKIINTYEEKPKNDKLFLFNVTIQNHGGYLISSSIFPNSIYLTDKDYSDVNQYLSLVKKSDDAFQELIKYFSSQTEPTLIVMFGDHQPALNNSFYEDLYKKPLYNLTLEERQKKYTVPFIIWANYDIKEQYVDKISTNYLSSLLLNVANLPSTRYNKFLNDTYKKLPVININGYVNSKGNYSTLDKLEDQNILNKYKILQYNNMFDTKNTVSTLFSETGLE